MKHIVTKLMLLAGGLASASIGVQASPTLGVDFTTDSLAQAKAAASGSYSALGSGDFGNPVGYEFQVTTPTTVVGLAAMVDHISGGASGSGNNHLYQAVPVALYSSATPAISSSWTEVTSATIPSGTLGTIGGSQNNAFAQVSITPIVLTDQYYIVAALDDYVAIGKTGVGWAEAPGISYVRSALGSGTSVGSPGTFSNPLASGSGGSSDYGLFGANIVTVPEPSQTLAGAMLLGCGGLMFAGRRLFKKAQVKA